MQANYEWQQLSKYECFLINEWLDKCISKKNGNSTFTNVQDIDLQPHLRERSCSVVECLTRDRRTPGSSITCVTALWRWARHINPSLVLVQPRKTSPIHRQVPWGLESWYEYQPSRATMVQIWMLSLICVYWDMHHLRNLNKNFVINSTNMTKARFIRQVCVKFKDFSRIFEWQSYCLQGLKTNENTDLHIKIILRKC